jgi:hypothetical protein
VCSNAIGNIGHKMLWNDGSGQFAIYDPTVSIERWKGRPTAVADFDLDGFMDIFIPNGRSISFQLWPINCFGATVTATIAEIDLVGTARTATVSGLGDRRPGRRHLRCKF